MASTRPDSSEDSTRATRPRARRRRVRRPRRFFAFEPASGCYEINPPFTLNSDVVERHLRTLLDAAERGGRPLMFVMVHAAAHARHARDGATRALPVDRAPLRERSERRSSGNREPRERPALAGARRAVRALPPPRLPARRGRAPLPRGQVLRPGPAPRLRAADAVHRALPRDGRGRAAVAGDARAPGRHRGRVRLAAAAASGWRGGAGGAGAALITMLAVASTAADSLDNAKLDQAPRPLHVPRCHSRVGCVHPRSRSLGRRYSLSSSEEPGQAEHRL